MHVAEHQGESRSGWCAVGSAKCNVERHFVGSKRVFNLANPAEMTRNRTATAIGPIPTGAANGSGVKVRTRLPAGERWIRTIGSPSELNIRTEPGGGEARIQLTAGNRMHWQKAGCELCSPVRVDTSAETASHVRFRSPANRRCRRYLVGLLGGGQAVPRKPHHSSGERTNQG